MTSPEPLAHKVAIITGAAHPKGMGAAIAHELARQGATVALVDIVSSRTALEDRVAEIIAADGDAIAVLADATKPDEVERAVNDVVSQRSTPDLLVNNAGVGIGSSHLLENSEETWETTLGVNLMGVNRFCCAVIPHMVAAGGGVIINNSSMAGLGALPGMPAPYTASKHAVIGLTKSIAFEFGRDNIRAIAICPGSIKTQLYDTTIELMMEAHRCSREEAEKVEADSIPLGYSCDADEVASVVGFLASPAASYLTGIAVPIAGGMAQGL